MGPTFFNISYGSKKLPVQIPAGHRFERVGMHSVEPHQDPTLMVESVLSYPIGCPPLVEAVSGAKRVVILTDDNTRPTPVHIILPGVLSHLRKAGVPFERIEILIATGTHRPMTKSELIAKLGKEVVENYKVTNHNYLEPGMLVEMGATQSGIPIAVNRLIADADFVIGIGNIAPHRYCGWSGGAKIIQPGVGGEPTTAGTHLMITKDPGAKLGKVENKVRHEMEEVAERCNLKFIVNTILDRYGNIYDLVAGDFKQAFREGAKRALPVYAVQVQNKADIVIASAHPFDHNLWQAGKVLYSADLVVKDGGIILIVSPCFEGVGEHQEFVELISDDYQEIENRIANGEVQDRISAAAALAVSLVRAHSTVWIVSEGISPIEASRMKIPVYTGLQDAITAALKAKGEKASILLMNEAAEILPILSGEEI